MLSPPCFWSASGIAFANYAEMFSALRTSTNSKIRSHAVKVWASKWHTTINTKRTLSSSLISIICFKSNHPSYPILCLPFTPTPLHPSTPPSYQCENYFIYACVWSIMQPVKIPFRKSCTAEPININAVSS